MYSNWKNNIECRKKAPNEHFKALSKAFQKPFEDLKKQEKHNDGEHYKRI